MLNSMVNAQLCTMGAIIDYTVGIHTKSSPRALDIQKAQEELRHNCDAREERTRELQFLEKGGNPLHFEFAHVATSTVPSTSFTNQIAEQNVISEAKGSFVASPPGDSVESNDRSGSSLCQEINTPDGGGKSDIIEDNIVKRGSKRLNAAQSKQSVSTGSNKSARKTEDSGLSRLVVKSQAYVRCNRSKPSRESANVSSIRSSVTPAKGSESRDEKGVARRKKAHDPVSSIKPAGSYSDNASKNTASDDQVAMELDGFQDVRRSDCVVKDELKAEELASTETPDTNSKVFIRQCDSSASTYDERESSARDEKIVDSHLDKHVGELDRRRLVPACAIEDSGIHKNAVDPPHEGTKIIIDDHIAADTNLVSTKVHGRSHDDLDDTGHSNNTLEESGKTSVKVNLDSVQPGSSNIRPVKDVMEVCDGVVVAQKDTGCPSSGLSMNTEGSPASNMKNDNCLIDPISSCPTAVRTDFPKNHVLDVIPSLKSDEPNMENDIKNSENLDKMAFEDSILRKACTIEASIKRASERLLCNISLEKRRKSRWDFVLEEMAWMAIDFMQERLWKSVAAAQMCHCIASEGRAKFEEASIQRKQKMIMKILAKGIMSFWCSTETSQTARRTAMMREHNSTMLERTTTSRIEADKGHSNKSLGARESFQPRQSQIQDYAVRFLEDNCKAADSPVLAEALPTSDRLNDFGILKVLDQPSEESLFYKVATGAMLAYRESVESPFEYHKSHMYDPRLQVEDYLKKRPESHQYNSNGIYAANGVQHASKKLKMKQGIDSSAKASRVASQMSNMVNPARFIKIITGRGHGKKCKALKMTASDGWSNFEDQALVVLVHDMGQNWELISDAIHSIVRFKSVHRQPNECKERHKVLMDRSSGGVDSAEDSGSSQRYHNSLPGISKGSARQLFERLQGPFEEENLKGNFEKIIRLMQQVHSRHRQGNSKELKPIMQPHSSHVIALSQAYVNKIPGGSLTPLDLCNSISPNLDSISPGSLSLGSHTNGFTPPNHQGSAVPATPMSNLITHLSCVKLLYRSPCYGSCGRY